MKLQHRAEVLGPITQVVSGNTRAAQSLGTSPSIITYWWEVTRLPTLGRNSERLLIQGKWPEDRDLA